VSESRRSRAARWKPLAVAITSLAAAAALAAAAPGQGQGSKTAPGKAAMTEAETDEQVVADFLRRKARAEKAQRAILAHQRRALDQKRAEFDDARRRFDDARHCYEEIVGPLARQGVMNPDDPRLPYEYEVRRWGGEPAEHRTSYLPRPGGTPSPR
jgi:hypothetical protein